MEINKFISAALGLVRFFIPGFRGKGDASNINRPQYAANGGCNEVKRSYLSETGSRCQANHRDGAGKRARQFFLLYPIASAVRTQLNWSQYKMLIAISDPDKREYYELEAVNNSWNGRELERQINSQLYERLLLCNDKESVLAVARKERIPETPQEVIKDPMVLEFLGLEKKPAFYETDLEGAIISHITELMTLPEGNKTILATEYNLYLPTTEQLVGEINEAKELVKKRTAMQQLSADAEMAGAIKRARSQF